MAGNQFQIIEARREDARARVGMCGTSGSGKSYSGILMACGIVQELLAAGRIKTLKGSVGVIDTERKSASLYVDIARQALGVPFVTIQLEAPYSVERYMGALEAMEKHGCSVIVLDQISHAWAGPGGVLAYVDTVKAQAKNSFSAWQKGTPLQQSFIERILASDAHIIATMRSKSEYVIEEIIDNGRKKSVPRKIGMQPVQREGVEFEFTTMLDLDAEGNTATASKDRSGLFYGQVFKITTEHGRKLARWLLEGADQAEVAPVVVGEVVHETPAAPAPAPVEDGPPAGELSSAMQVLSALLSTRADELMAFAGSGADRKTIRSAIGRKVMEAAGVKQGQAATLAQVEQMLALIPDTEV